MTPERIAHDEVAALAGIQPARVIRVVREFERGVRERWHGARLIWQRAGGDLWIVFRSLPDQLREAFTEREFRRRQFTMKFTISSEGERDAIKPKRRRGRPAKAAVRTHSQGSEGPVR